MLKKILLTACFVGFSFSSLSIQAAGMAFCNKEPSQPYRCLLADYPRDTTPIWVTSVYYSRHGRDHMSSGDCNPSDQEYLSGGYSTLLSDCQNRLGGEFITFSGQK